VIVIDGNDGTGKTTLVEALRASGFIAKDRGIPTKATDEGAPPRESLPEDETYIILDAPPGLCQQRLLKAGRDITEKYHTMEDLEHYRERFLKVAEELGAAVIDSSGDEEAVLRRALKCIGATGPVRVGVPKGRLFQALVGYLESRGVRCLDSIPARQLKVKGDGACFYILKPRSIPQLVALGYLDAGFCGCDIMMESGYDDRLSVYADTKLCPVRLCVGSADPAILERPARRPLAIATEFPHLASRWAFLKNLAHLCLNSWGSTEAWAPELADLVFDVVETGETMTANGLTVLETVLESTTVLVERSSGSPLMHTEFGRKMRCGSVTH
jgi:ATP phosphoribosyltransferase